MFQFEIIWYYFQMQYFGLKDTDDIALYILKYRKMGYTNYI